MCHVYRLLYYLVCVFDVYDQISFSFSPVFPESVQWRLGYWNLSLILSHSLERYKKSLVVT